jgi:lipoprotein-anchoring transpeptidase ErfK/SrfK
MKKLVAVIALSLPMVVQAASTDGGSIYYGTGLCASPDYQCVKINRGESWTSLFPNEEQRDLVQRINRSYNSLWPGKEIAVPRDLSHASMRSLSPFPLNINADPEKRIIVDQDKLAWVAYDEQGHMVKWGPIASGRDKCSDSNNSCRTLTGIFRIFSKENQNCKSDIFPIGKGGAKMPYCMYFHKGFALHGSDDIPGYRASHGCVRMFVQDAKWLNEHWVDSTSEKTNTLGTVVVVRPVTLAGQVIAPISSASETKTTPRRAAAPTVWRNPDSFPPSFGERQR